MARTVTPAEELKFRPRALVLWWCGEPGSGCTGGIGFATDGSGAASAAWAADDALAPGLLNHRGAETALLFLEDPLSPDAACSGHVRFSQRGFSVECDREPRKPWLVHYLALGGSDLQSAGVRSLVLDSTGTRNVTDVGFTPDIVLATLGAGPTLGGPKPGLAVGFGAAARLGDQVAGGFVAEEDAGGTIARGAQCTDVIAVVPEAAGSRDLGALSRVVSFDGDGFTLETTRLTSQLPLAVLALAGGSFGVGLGTASSRTTAVGFEPAGSLLFGTGLNATPHPRDIGRMCVGGFSRDQRAGCVSWSTLRRGAWPPEPRSRSSSSAVFEVMDTTSGELHAQAELSRLGQRGFALRWPVKDRHPRDFGYVAFGTHFDKSTPRGGLRLFGRRRSLRE